MTPGDQLDARLERIQALWKEIARTPKPSARYRELVRENRAAPWRIGRALTPQWAPSTHFPDDRRFVYYEHVVGGVMQLDDSRVVHA